MDVRFEWDPAKETANRRKHGIGFTLAVRVFADPFALTDHDRIENGERRWQTIGVIEGVALVLVAHTIHETAESGRTVEVVRIISARAADRKERRRYEEDFR